MKIKRAISGQCYILQYIINISRRSYPRNNLFKPRCSITKRKLTASAKTAGRHHGLISSVPYIPCISTKDPCNIRSTRRYDKILNQENLQGAMFHTTGRNDRTLHNTKDYKSQPQPNIKNHCLVRWYPYGSDGDIWESTQHLPHTKIF